ncbi:MAG: ABC transporter permease [Vicinamibacterales bacterium]
MSVSSTNPAHSTELPVYRIAPAHGWIPVRLGELWEYRELLYFMVWRDVKVRYKQTALGVAWAVMQPFFTMVVFSIFFGKLAKIPTGGVPYPVLVYCALMPWQLFAFALTESSNSVVANQRLLTKVYFPRLLMPIAAVCMGLADFAVSFVVLLLLMAYYGIAPGWAALTVPLWAIFAVAVAIAVGLWLSALNVRYRDIRYTLPFLTQLWLIATPVVYPSALVPEAWRGVYALNPMVGVVDGFRWALVGGPSPQATLGVSAIAVLVILVSGLLYFRRTERTFADVV